MTTKITNDNIADNSITVDKLAPSLIANLYTAGEGIIIEANGRISAESIGPSITGFTVQGTDDLALDPAGGQTIIIQGTRFQEGASIQVGSNIISVVTFIDSTTLQFTSEALSSGLYNLYVINPDNSIAALSPGLPYSGFPTFVTESGSLGTYYETTQISETIEAAEANDTITYAVVSGQLPPGANLLSNGTIIGTAPFEIASNTYSFTIAATDEENQSTTRSFNLTINTDVITWIYPANAAILNLEGGGLMTNVELSATSATGYNISYSANALPSNVYLSGNVIYGTPNVEQEVSTLFTATTDTTNRSATRTVNWSVSFGDIYFNQTTLLLNGDVVTYITDVSDNSLTITPVNDTSPRAFSPFSDASSGSTYFDGNGDYIIGATGDSTLNTALDILGGDYTIEFWMYKTVNTAQTVVTNFTNAGQNGWVMGLREDGAISISHWVNNAATTITSQFGQFNLNEWTHVAVVKNSGNYYFYANGVDAGIFQNGSRAAPANGGAGTGLGIGAYIQNLQFAGYYTGYISNLRIVKGTAIYTEAFTPPTSPLTAVSGTSLLTLQSRIGYNNRQIIDESNVNNTITTVNNATAGSFSPHGPTGWSGYFDGNGDYLTTASIAEMAFGTGDFTVEGWFYFTGTISTYQRPWGFGDNNDNIEINGSVLRVGGGSQGTLITGSTTILANQWYHIALVRSSGTYKLYLNGTQEGSSATNSYNSSSRTFGVMAYPTGANPSAGYVSNLRIVKGSAVYNANFTPSTNPLEPTGETSLLTLRSNSFKDDGPNNVTISINGETKIMPFSPFTSHTITPDSYSIYFDGSDEIEIDHDDVLNIFNGDYTVEAWIWPEGSQATSTGIVGKGSADTGWTFNVSGTNLQLNVAATTGFLASGSGAITPYVWQHVAFCRTGSTLNLFINGQIVDTATRSANDNTTNKFRIGTNRITTGDFKGFISNIRVVDEALYTENFTPSTAPLTVTNTTVLLTAQSSNFEEMANELPVIVLSGTPKPFKFNPFGETVTKIVEYSPASHGGSVYFDGTGDYLTFTKNTTTGDFTCECWFYFTQNASVRHVLFGGDNTTGNQTQFAVENDGDIRIIMTNDNTTTSTPVIKGAWNHIAFVRKGSATNNITVFVNGTSVLNATSTAALNVDRIANIGTAAPAAGYISNARIVNDALYTSAFVPPQAPVDPIPGTVLLINGSNAAIYDVSGKNVLETAGNTRVVNGVKKYGTGALAFDGTGDWLTCPGSTNWAFGLGDFTIECWFYTTAVSTRGHIVANRNSTDSWELFTFNSKVYFGNGTTDFLIQSDTLSNSTWYHIAVSRSGTSLKLYINGVEKASATNSTDFSNTTNVLGIGAMRDTGTYPLNGYIDDLRITKGVARYTADFDPPTGRHRVK